MAAPARHSEQPPASPASTAAAAGAAQRLADNPALEIPGWDVDRFAEPTDQKPSVLWFFNRKQTEAQIDQTLEEMHQAGFTETVIFRWPETGPNPPETFFSEEWFDRVEHVLEKSAELGMKVWLSNDYKFPSGAAGGLIVNGGTVGDKVYEPRPDLGFKTAVRSGAITVNGGADGGTEIDVEALFGSSIQLEEGQVVADAGSAPGITLLKQGAAWSDYAVDARFTIENATAGFMVRSPDQRNGYLLDVRKTGQVDIYKQVNGSFSALQVGGPVPAGWDPNGAHDIQIRAQGSQISATLDGMAVGPVSDSQFPTGRVGMRVDGGQRWRLDSLAVNAVPGGAALYANDFSEPASVGDFDVAVTPVENVIAVTARPATGDGATDLEQVIDLTDTLDGTWTAPPGRWRVEAYTYRLKGDDYADTLSTEAMELYDEIIMGEYHDRFAWAFGNVLKGFADDESQVANAFEDPNAVPWTPELADVLGSRGVEVGQAMVSTFNDMGRKGSTVKGDFYRAANDQFVDAYWKTKYDWAEEHGVSIVSNPLHDELGPAAETRYSGNLMTAHQWAQIPGTDLIGADQAVGRFRHVGRTASSVAHQLGRPLVYNEMLGAMDWHISLDHVREATASQAVRGVNFSLYHTTYDEIEGIPFPPVFMTENTWWPWMDETNEWAGRVMEFGRHMTSAPTALLYMSRSNEAVQRSEAGGGSDQNYLTTVHALENSQVDFDLLDEGALSADPQIIAKAEIGDGEMRVGEMTYTTVVVPSAPFLSLEAARTLRDFAAAGGEIVWSGAAPTQEYNGRDAELAATIAEINTIGGARVVATASPGEAGGAAADLGQSAVELSAPSAGVRVLRFSQGGTDGYLVLNEGGQPVTVDVTFPSTGVPAIWDPETGDVAEPPVYREGEDGTVVVPMTLDPRAPLGVTVSPDSGRAHVTRTSGPGEVVDSSVVDGVLTATVRSERDGTTVVRGTDGAGNRLSAVATASGTPQDVALDGDWTMALDNGSAPVTRPLRSWTDVAPNYSGSATYTREFSLTADQLDGSGWRLDLGRVANVAEVTVNGQDVGTRLWAPFDLDLGSSLQVGVNTIEVRVANTDANARGGQALTSGLLGPVSLIPSTASTVTLTETPIGAERVSAAMNDAGTAAAVTLEVSNTSAQPVSGRVEATGPEGWTTRASAPVTVPAGGTASGTAQLFPGGFVEDGPVPVEAHFVVDGATVDGLTGSLDSSFVTPPTGASDHVDLGDAASEQAHALTAASNSGTDVEAGLTRRAGSWYEFDLAVTAGQGFVLQGRDTWDASGARRVYTIAIDGQVVGTRDHSRPTPGVAGYRLHVPARFVTSDQVRVRIQATANPAYSDPSLADVWAAPAVDDTTAPTTSATVTSPLPGESGWHRAPATVTLTASDDRDLAPELEWGIDAGWQPYDGPVPVTTEGVTTISHRATDAAGNRSMAGSVEVRIDTVAPQTTVAADLAGGGQQPGRATVRLTAVDVTSGVATTRYRLDGGDWETYSGPVAVQGAGTHRIEVSSDDVAGNVEQTRSVTIDLRDVDRVAAVVAPQVRGEARVGARLHSTTGSWNTSGLTFRRQWLRNGTPIARASAASYVVTAADVGKRLSVRVTASRAGLAPGVSTSSSTTPVARATATVRVTLNKATAQRRKPITVTAVVASGTRAAGRVAVLVDGRRVKTVTLRGGRATTQVRIARRGQHRIVVRYLGSSSVAPAASAPRTVRIR